MVVLWLIVNIAFREVIRSALALTSKILVGSHFASGYYLGPTVEDQGNTTTDNLVSSRLEL